MLDQWIEEVYGLNKLVVAKAVGEHRGPNRLETAADQQASSALVDPVVETNAPSAPALSVQKTCADFRGRWQPSKISISKELSHRIDYAGCCASERLWYPSKATGDRSADETEAIEFSCVLSAIDVTYRELRPCQLSKLLPNNGSNS